MFTFCIIINPTYVCQIYYYFKSEVMSLGFNLQIMPSLKEFSVDKSVLS